jgi:hypothetical protein
MFDTTDFQNHWMDYGNRVWSGKSSHITSHTQPKQLNLVLCFLSAANRPPGSYPTKWGTGRALGSHELGLADACRSLACRSMPISSAMLFFFVAICTWKKECSSAKGGYGIWISFFFALCAVIVSWYPQHRSWCTLVVWGFINIKTGSWAFFLKKTESAVLNSGYICCLQLRNAQLLSITHTN